MRPAFTLLAFPFLFVGLIMTGCSKTPDAGPTNEQTTAWRAGDWIVGEPVQHANLTIVPLLSPTPRMDDRFITLDEGLKAGTVEILEVGAAAAVEQEPAQQDPPATQANAPDVAEAPPALELNQRSAARTTISQRRGMGNRVNTLLVVNRSEKPLYLMPGEIVVGGQQDRVVGQEVVVAANSKPVPIDVYCVEHGRWHNRSAQQYAEVMAAAQQQLQSCPAAAPVFGYDGVAAAVREADAGKFVGSMGSVSKEARMAVIYNNDQGKVWDEVAKANAASGAKTESGAFTANYAQEEVVDRLSPYLEKLHQPIADTQRVVGVVVAINGQTQSYDVFESTPLFKKLWPKLLKSAALDAANQLEDGNARTCSREAAQQFVNEVLNAPVERSEAKSGLNVVTNSTDRVLTTAAAEQTPGGQTVHAAAMSR